MATFAERLKKLRKEKGLTQPEFAKEIGCSASAVASYETGRRTPNLETILAMADYFDVRTACLTGEDFVKELLKKRTEEVR